MWDPFPWLQNEQDDESAASAGPVEELPEDSPVMWDPFPLPEEITSAIEELGYADGEESRLEGWEYPVGPDCTDCCIDCMFARLEIWRHSTQVTQQQHADAVVVWDFFFQATEEERSLMAGIYARSFWEGFL